MMTPMHHDDGSQQPRRSALTRGDWALTALGVVCVIGQAIVYRGPNPSTAARVAVITLGVAAFGCFFTMAGMVARRARAQRRSSP